MKHLFQFQSILPLLAVSTLVVSQLTGCGKDEAEIKQQTAPSLAFEAPTLAIPKFTQRGTLDTNFGFTIKNVGEKTLNVTEIELKNLPARISMRGEENQSQSCPTQQDSACRTGANSEAICLNGRCFQGKFELPQTIEPNQSWTPQLALRKGSLDLACPPAPEGTPEEFKAKYCGEIHIRTNAGNTNDSGNIKGGVGIIYLQYNGHLGDISYSPSSVSFSGVLPGYLEEQLITLENIGEAPLTINKISLGDNPKGLLSLSSVLSFPFTIPPQGTQEIKLKYDATASGITTNDLTFKSTLIIESSAERSPEKIDIHSTTKYTPAPVLSFAPTLLNFAKTPGTKDVTFSNRGGATLLIRNMQIPGGKNANYNYVIKDSDGKEINSLTIPKGKNQTVTIDLTGDGTNALNKLTFSSNDASYANDTEIILVGTRPQGGYLNVYPRFSNTSSLIFNASDEVGAKRHFLMINRGNERAVVRPNFEGTTPPPFELLNQKHPIVIEPNDYHIGTIRLKEKPSEEKKATLKFKIGKDHADADKFGDANSSGKGLQLIYNPTTPTTPTLDVRGSSTEVFVGRAYSLRATGAPENALCEWMIFKRPKLSKLVVIKKMNCDQPLQLLPDAKGEYQILTSYSTEEGTVEKIFPFTAKEETTN